MSDEKFEMLLRAICNCVLIMSVAYCTAHIQ